MIKEIQSAFAVGRVKWRLHALQRMLERGISRADVASVVGSGEIIESYPTGKSFPACLIFGLVGDRPMHAVVAWDAETETAYIITAYQPDQEHFGVDFKTRRN
jgi:hypothetical protein